MNVNVLVDLANMIFLSAYLVKDILRLRLLAILASLVSISYYLLQPEPLWTPAIWSCVFITIHAARAWGIARERRPVAFTRDEQLLYDRTFSPLSPQQFKRVLARGKWRDFRRGDVLHSAGGPSDSVEAVVEGELEARRHGHVLGHAQPGDLAGLASLLGGSPELYDVVVTKPARVITWRLADLEELAGADESLKSALRKIAAAAIAENLIRAVQAEW
jgi:Popeye protein conserved region